MRKLTVLLCLLALAGVAQAGPEGKSKKSASGSQAPASSQQLPKGVQMKVERGGALPPGWEKKLQKGKPLDSEIIAHAEVVPASLKVKLPVGPAGSVEIKVEGKIIRIDETTKAVLDVFDI